MAFLLFVLTACNATCRQSCQKLASCAEVDSTGTIEAECRETCLAQEFLYEEDWEDEVLLAAFEEQRNCIRDSSCEQIAEGVCYDETLWTW